MNSMNWPDIELEPVERYLHQGSVTRIGRFDCHRDHACFPVSESISDNMFVVSTRPVWVRRQTKEFRYIQSGSVLIHHAGATIERKPAQSEKHTAYWFSVAPQEFDETLAIHFKEHLKLQEGLSVDPGIQLELARILRDLHSGTMTSSDIDDAVLTLLDSICQKSSGPVRTTLDELVTRPRARAKAKSQIDRAKAYIDGNLSNDVGLHDIAKEVGLSAYYLCRLFKAVSGVTIRQYKIRQRLSRVLDALANGRGTDLSRLAFDAGFSSHSHLTRLFANRYGMPPSQFRELSTA